MGKISELELQKKIKALMNLMMGDRIEITYIPKEMPFALPITQCVYFVDWRVIEHEIRICETKLADRIPLQNPSHEIIIMSIKYISEIKKLTPTR